MCGNSSFLWTLTIKIKVKKLNIEFCLGVVEAAVRGNLVGKGLQSGAFFFWCLGKLHFWYTFGVTTSPVGVQNRRIYYCLTPSYESDLSCVKTTFAPVSVVAQSALKPNPFFFCLFVFRSCLAVYHYLPSFFPDNLPRLYFSTADGSYGNDSGEGRGCSLTESLSSGQRGGAVGVFMRRERTHGEERQEWSCLAQCFALSVSPSAGSGVMTRYLGILWETQRKESLKTRKQKHETRSLLIAHAHFSRPIYSSFVGVIITEVKSDPVSDNYCAPSGNASL